MFFSYEAKEITTLNNKIYSTSVKGSNRAKILRITLIFKHLLNTSLNFIAVIYLFTALNTKASSTKGKAAVLKYLKLSSSIFLFHHSHPHLPHTSHAPKPLHCSQLPPSYANIHPMCTLHVGVSMNRLNFSALVHT